MRKRKRERENMVVYTKIEYKMYIVCSFVLLCRCCAVYIAPPCILMQHCRLKRTTRSMGKNNKRLCAQATKNDKNKIAKNVIWWELKNIYRMRESERESRGASKNDGKTEWKIVGERVGKRIVVYFWLQYLYIHSHAYSDPIDGNQMQRSMEILRRCILYSLS